MPISNEHLTKTCQVWDGTTYHMMDVKEAQSKEKKGFLQIVTNLQAKDLKRKEDFNVEGSEPARKKKTYKTRQLKAETK